MVVLTATARLEILGTQLDVDCDAAATSVSVSKGLVRVTRLVDGRVAEVPANHQTVATVNRQATLLATPRRDPVRVWRSQLPRDSKYGSWSGGAGETGGLRAASLLLNGGTPQAKLLFLAVVEAASRDSPPLLLDRTARIRIRGRLETTAEVYCGITLRHPNGGFAGKSIVLRTVEVPAGGQTFDRTIPLAAFTPLEASFPATPMGLELVDCWCMTVREDHGLIVTEIELQSDRP